jgi:hypothetical protein
MGPTIALLSISGSLVRRVSRAWEPGSEIEPRIKERETIVRFMMLVIPKAYADVRREDFVPPADLVAKMTKYNEALTKAGILLGLDGLHPPVKATRLTFAGGKPKLTDGPFAEAKEIVGGYWLIQVKSKEEAVEWAKRAPMLNGDIIEVRQVQELSEFPPDVQRAAGAKIAV